MCRLGRLPPRASFASVSSGNSIVPAGEHLREVPDWWCRWWCWISWVRCACPSGQNSTILAVSVVAEQDLISGQCHQPEAGGFVQAPVLGFQDDNGRRDDLAAITTVKTRSNLCYPRWPTAVSTWYCPRAVPRMSAPHICPNTLEIDMLHPEVVT